MRIQRKRQGLARIVGAIAIRQLHLIEAQGFACRPCQREEDEACILTKTCNSACMQAITADHILDDVQQMLGERDRIKKLSGQLLLLF